VPSGPGPPSGGSAEPVRPRADASGNRPSPRDLAEIEDRQRRIIGLSESKDDASLRHLPGSGKRWPQTLPGGRCTYPLARAARQSDLRSAPGNRLIESTGRATSRYSGARARTARATVISGYLGSNEDFDHAIADFAIAYADQNEKDYQQLLKAISAGRVLATVEH
jgi:Uncharacterized protein conserved in bacteria (DUF2252)